MDRTGALLLSFLENKVWVAATCVLRNVNFTFHKTQVAASKHVKIAGFADRLPTGRY